MVERTNNAQTVFCLVGAHFAAFLDTAHAMRLNTQEYLQEEARLVPAEAELKAYLDAVDDLRMDVDRLEARLKQLEAN